MGLKSRILLAVSLSVLFSTLVMLLLFLKVLREDTEQLVGAQLSDTVAFVADGLAQGLHVRVEVLQRLTDSLPADAVEQPETLRRALALQPFPADLFSLGGGVVRLRDMRVVAEMPPVQPGRLGGYAGNNKQSVAAASQPRVFVGQPYLGTFSHKPIFPIYVPLLDERGAHVAMVGGISQLTDRALFNGLQAMHLSSKGYVLVVSRSARMIISSSDTNRLLENLPPPGINANIDRRLTGFEGLAIGRSLKGEEVLSVARAVPDFPDWMVIGVVPTHEAFGPVRRLRNSFLVLALAVTALCLLVLWRMVSRQLRPLERASRDMARMRKGELPLGPLPLAGPADEIGEMITQFNELVSDRRLYEERVAHLAYHDALTDLPNRRMAQVQFEHMRQQARRHGYGLALVLLDLDGFKAINDALGHTTGDEFLTNLAQRLRAGVRSIDVISRLGGDEFLVLLHEVQEPGQVAGVCTKLLHIGSERVDVQGHELSSSISVGVAVYPSDGEDFETLFKCADVAMYEAKRSGRNTCRFFTERLNVAAEEYQKVREGLRRAIDGGELVLHYQPQLEVATGRVVGVEALVRWLHPVEGLIHPGRFIAVAEQSGLIVPLGEWVMQEACRQAALWHRAGHADLLVAVNVSALQFIRGHVDELIQCCLLASGLPAHCLELEITESALITDAPLVLAQLERIEALYTQLALDDFGSGYSSFAYLRQLRLDKLKIDQLFVRELTQSAQAETLLAAMVQMGHGLGFKVLAEGAETAEQIDTLRRLGCDQIQGYGFARPMDAAAMTTFLSKHAASTLPAQAG
ncbi:putative bifunctional diguanylate cyclase/phosphodiesterase [Hydrogenophaga sp. OTU3427]|uniref:putative bifunctional diguanylate cyclase/phosphodiesterase n=1 Tax=Hydrogenophaga sp. OTU3427 TaxID=3043856 RepID=UPI00313ED191